MPQTRLLITSAMLSFGIFSCLTPVTAGPRDFERSQDVPLPSFIATGKPPQTEQQSTSPPAKPPEAKPVQHHNLPWSYEDPAAWGEVSQKFHLCKDGKRQSPIDIQDSSYANLGAINFNYRSGPKEIVNNGHTIQVNMLPGSYITVSGKRYNLLQFHFHAPSEHTINGKAAAMVIHFVHQATDGELSVIALLLEKCKQNQVIGQFWRKLPIRYGEKNRLSRKIRIRSLLPQNRAYYTYPGSLTTPPCTEGVNWIVMKRPVEVSGSQIEAFTKLFPASTRPIQPAYYRVIKTKN